MYNHDYSVAIIGNGRDRELQDELKQYEMDVPMTHEEREAVRSWVASGHSVQETKKSAYISPDLVPQHFDFLDLYRIDRYISDTVMESQLGRKGTQVKREYGRTVLDDGGEELPFDPYDEREGQAADDSFRQEFSAMRRKLYWLWAYINEEGDYEDAADYVEDHLDVRTPFEL